MIKLPKEYLVMEDPDSETLVLYTPNILGSI